MKIVLIHGLLRTEKSLKRLGNYLSSLGHTVCHYRYPSSRYVIADHGDHFADYLSRLTMDDQESTFAIISHSLGGIVARQALCQLPEKQAARFQKLIMLTPPNKGSAMARRICARYPLLPRLLKPLRQLSDEPHAFVHQVPVPNNIEIGVVAAEFDKKTPPYTTHLKQQSDFICVPARHTFVMNHQAAKQAIKSFLETGQFISD